MSPWEIRENPITGLWIVYHHGLMVRVCNTEVEADKWLASVLDETRHTETWRTQ